MIKVRYGKIEHSMSDGCRRLDLEDFPWLNDFAVGSIVFDIASKNATVNLNQDSCAYNSLRVLNKEDHGIAGVFNDEFVEVTAKMPFVRLVVVDEADNVVGNILTIEKVQ